MGYSLLMATYDIWKRPTHLMSRAECLTALEAHGPIHAGVFTQKELEDLYESGLACLLPNSDLVILKHRTYGEDIVMVRTHTISIGD